ncbi:MAG: zf-TFIIB domain-containing protein [Chthoniobacteraceae bacterium]
MKCPACSNELTPFNLGGVTVDACKGGCAGIWFDAFELQNVDEEDEVAQEWLLRVERNPEINVDLTRRRECPRCEGIPLRRHFFSAKREIEVDLCPNCAGYWLDAGELEQIRAEKAGTAAAAEVNDARLSMETIRFLYRQKKNLVRRGSN